MHGSSLVTSAGGRCGRLTTDRGYSLQYSCRFGACCGADAICSPMASGAACLQPEWLESRAGQGFGQGQWSPAGTCTLTAIPAPSRKQACSQPGCQQEFTRNQRGCAMTGPTVSVRAATPAEAAAPLPELRFQP